MKVVRQIVFEGTEEQLVKQLTHSAPDGKFRLPSGFLKGLTIKIITISQPNSYSIKSAIDHDPKQFPICYKVPE
jgi:hypothetical protein